MRIDVVKPARRVLAGLCAATIVSGVLVAEARQFGGVFIEGIELVLEGAPPDRAAAILQDRTGQQLSTQIPIDKNSAIARQSGAGVATTKPSPKLSGPAMTVGPSLANPPTVNAAPKASAAPKQPTGDRVLYTNPTLLSGGQICGMIEDPANRKAVNDLLYGLLTSQVQSRLPGGFGIHSRTNHQLSTGCTARAEVVGNRITVTSSLPRNRYFAQITTPGPFGADTDPNFHIFYDLKTEATFVLPTTTAGKLVQESVRVSATNVTKPQSNNLISKAAIAANDLVSFLGGPNFIDRIRQDRNYKAGSFINIDLAEINRQLGGAAPSLRLEMSYKGNTLVLRATPRPEPQRPIVR